MIRPSSPALQKGMVPRTFLSPFARLTVLALLVLASLAPAQGDSQYRWRIKKVNGRDYVTASDIHKFYRFNKKYVHGKRW